MNINADEISLAEKDSMIHGKIYFTRKHVKNEKSEEMRVIYEHNLRSIKIDNIS